MAATIFVERPSATSQRVEHTITKLVDISLRCNRRSASWRSRSLSKLAKLPATKVRDVEESPLRKDDVGGRMV